MKMLRKIGLFVPLCLLAHPVSGEVTPRNGEWRWVTGELTLLNVCAVTLACDDAGTASRFTRECLFGPREELLIAGKNRFCVKIGSATPKEVWDDAYKAASAACASGTLSWTIGERCGGGLEDMSKGGVRCVPTANVYAKRGWLYPKHVLIVGDRCDPNGSVTQAPPEPVSYAHLTSSVSAPRIGGDSFEPSLPGYASVSGSGACRGRMEPPRGGSILYSPSDPAAWPLDDSGSVACGSAEPSSSPVF